MLNNRRFTDLTTKSIKRVLLCTCLIGASASVQAADLGIENDAEYAVFLDAVRAAEYVRTDSMLSEMGNQRAFGVIAAVSAFVDINPNATPEQVSIFMSMFDASLSEASTDDPNLNRVEDFVAAVRYTVIEEPALEGLDMRVGVLALSLLGVVIPEPDGFESIQQRMVRYESAIARPINQNRNELYDLLVRGFMGQDASGTVREELAEMLDQYLSNQGFMPMLGMVRVDRENVEAAMAMLPADYEGYQLAIVPGAENDALRGSIQIEMDQLQLHIDQLLADISSSLEEAPGLLENTEATPEEMEDLLEELHENLENSTRARALSSAAALLMLQSQFDEIDHYATLTRNYTAAAAEMDNTFAYLESGLSFTQHLAGAFLAGDDTAAYVDNLFGLAGDVLGFTELFVSGPSVDEQIFEQVIELRQQVEDLRVEMHERFDRIDQQLNVMYSTIVFGFDQIGDQIGDLQSDVDSLILDMAAARSQLRRLEQALYGVAEDILLTDLTSESNTVLDYRDENGIDLPYSGGSPDFITASESFFTYANVTALSEAFSGSRSNPTVLLHNADDYIGAGPVTNRINDLAVLPASLGVSLLATTDLVGIEPWTQAASAYAQLARENPWYFAFRYQTQLEDYNADPGNESLPELDRTILSGQRIVQFIDSIREQDSNGESALFGALIQNYRNAADSFQAEVDQFIEEQIPPSFTNGSTTLDYWGETDQEISQLLPTLSTVALTDFAGTISLLVNAANKGYRTFSSITNLSEARRAQVYHLIKRQRAIENGQSAADFRLRARALNIVGEVVLYLYLGDSPNTVNYETARIIRMSQQFNIGGLWQYFPVSSDADARNLVVTSWSNSAIEDQIAFSKSTPSVGSTWTVTPGFQRLRVNSSSPYVAQDQTILPEMHQCRQEVRTAMLASMLNSNSTLNNAARNLDHAEALIDAYVSIGMPEELNASDLLRSALRGAPGSSEIGLRSLDVVRMIADIEEADNSETPIDRDQSVLALGDMLNDRIDIVEEEILAGLDRPLAVPGYVQWMIKELENLRATAFTLATDDTYIASNDGSVVGTNENGLLSNDIDQEFRTIAVDIDYVNEPEYIAPANGQVSIDPDGTFVYQADPGFHGTDTFTYRTVSTITTNGGVFQSAPATVLLIVNNQLCGRADITEDGTLNFLDVSAFLAAFGAQDAVADFNDDGSFNFLDVSSFLSMYASGCP